LESFFKIFSLEKVTKEEVNYNVKNGVLNLKDDCENYPEKTLGTGVQSRNNNSLDQGADQVRLKSFIC
jgi:hypothetical protein